MGCGIIGHNRLRLAATQQHMRHRAHDQIMIGIVVDTDHGIHVIVYLEVQSAVAPHIDDGHIAEQSVADWRDCR